MQTLVQVVCKKGGSLRDDIVNDAYLEEFGFEVRQKQQPGRRPGWAKLRSNKDDRKGALNMEWDADTHLLLCRVVNKGAGRPHLIVGDLVDYLLDRFRRRIRLVTVLPQ